MKTKPPPDRRKFANHWDEIEYLYHKVLYWLYEREEESKARPFADRLGKVLAKADPKQEAILGQECRSLVYETKGDFPKAIAHRDQEIRLIRRLHEISLGTATEAITLRDYGYADLSARLDLLARLYHVAGQLDRAITTLEESKRLCKEHGIRFDAADMLAEYQEENRGTLNGPANGGRDFASGGPSALAGKPRGRMGAQQ
jgi:tetratricopeptide (TPR) repeat protein